MHGHLALTLSNAVYANLSPISFMVPPNPGATPIIPAGATAAQTSSLERQHTESLRIWREYNIVQDALKHQLMQAIDPIYIESLNNRYTGFAGVMIWQVINHLYQRYGNITAHDLDKNDKLFKHPYDPAEPIEVLYKQIDATMHYADAGEQPYSPSQIVNNAYNIISHTGIFTEACRNWRARPAAEKTWATFRTCYFTTAWQDLQDNQLLTTKNQGYQQSTNMVEQQAFTNDTAQAFANLASATATDRSTIAALCLQQPLKHTSSHNSEHPSYPSPYCAIMDARQNSIGTKSPSPKMTKSSSSKDP
jgi:hypothetical protein